MSHPGDGTGTRKLDPSATRSSGSQQHSPSTQNPPRGLPRRQSYPPIATQYFPSSTNVAVNAPDAQRYQASMGTQYHQYGAYMGQYTMPPQPHVHMVPPQHHYPYPIHHGGLHNPDVNLSTQFSSMNLGNRAIAPHPQVQGSMYAYQRLLPDGAPSGSTAFVSGHNTAETSVYEPPRSPVSSQPVHAAAQSHPPAYPGQRGAGSYNSLHYPPINAQYQASFPPSPSQYQPQYTTPYSFIPQQSPDESQSPSGWWYVASSPAAGGTAHSTYDPHTYAYPQIAYHRDPETHSNSSFAPPPSHSASTAQHMQPQHDPASRTPHHSSITTPGSSSGRQEATRRPSPPRQPNASAPYASEPLALVPHASDRSGGSDPLVGHSGEQGAVRKVYHPNPPPHRSEWVMWVGNIPSDVTHDELWRYFNQPPGNAPAIRSQSVAGQGQQKPASSPQEIALPASLDAEPSAAALQDAKTSQPSTVWGGVSSIFLISQSNCAFVNFEHQVHLEAAVKRFNGMPIWPNDPRCPKLVCRIRRRDDDLRAGVGAQRGMGMHTRWVKEAKGQRVRGEDGAGHGEGETTDQRSLSGASSSPTRETVSTDPTGSPESGRDGTLHQSNSSGDSYASTTSSFLSRHFSKRYFILKSLTEYDLNLSVERGLWATQPHNEVILDQAYRTSKEIYLIFSVNKSGEFFGYARMAGPIGDTEQKIPWASRPGSSIPAQGSTVSEQSVEGANHPGLSTFLSQLPLQASPLPLETPKPSRSPISSSSPGVLPGLTGNAQAQGGERGKGKALPPPAIGPGQQMEDNEIDITGAERAEMWGTPFKIQWIRTNRLPFHRTRQLRNPWNQDREVKVSRDGTEIEPTVGQALLDEWDKPDQAPAPPAVRTQSGRRGGSKAQSRGNQTVGNSRSATPHQTQPRGPGQTIRRLTGQGTEEPGDARPHS